VTAFWLYTQAMEYVPNFNARFGGHIFVAVVVIAIGSYIVSKVLGFRKKQMF